MEGEKLPCKLPAIPKKQTQNNFSGLQRVENMMKQWFQQMVENDFSNSTWICKVFTGLISNDRSNQQINNHRSIQGFWWVTSKVVLSGKSAKGKAKCKEFFTSDLPLVVSWNWPADFHIAMFNAFIYVWPNYNIHQPRFNWNKGISRTKPPFGVRSCEVAIIWPDTYIYIDIHDSLGGNIELTVCSQCRIFFLFCKTFNW